MCVPKHNELYTGMKPSDALRKLKNRFIRKQECKEMLDAVAVYIENLERQAKTVETLNKIDDLSFSLNDVAEHLEDINQSLENYERVG